MGKSSLRVQMMQKLVSEGIACAFIDLTEIGIQSVTLEKWYAGVIGSLVSSFNLSGQFNWRSWWKERELISPVQRLSEFIQDVLLQYVDRNIVIFVDEIDTVLSLNFPIDDFFALIRACYNKRVDRPEYYRLTFALLGVATPSDLIQDKTRTPFNIGRAIALDGFKLEEAQPLAEGLAGKISNPQSVLQEILSWTGGQPFLTQKLCKIVRQYLETKSIESGSQEVKDNSPSLIAELVQWLVVENWETQDEPEHLRTIRDRILYSSNSTSKLLGLYQQILQKGEISVDNSYEQMQLQLSGLVVKQQGSLRVYNCIYESVFDSHWVEKALANLRPYSESITAWLESKSQDESRLLQGKALQDAQAWAADKNLSDADYHFLNASLDFDRREAQAALATEKAASQMLTEANQKAKRTIKRGVAGLIAISVGAVAVIAWASTTLQKAQKDLKETQIVTRLEREAKNIEQQFQFSQLDTLVSTMQAAQELKDIVSNDRPLEEYPTTTPMLSLQTVLDRIQERNGIESKNEVFKTVEFSPDGKLIATVGSSGMVRLWTFQGRQIAEFSLGENLTTILGLTKVKFSPDGKFLATNIADDKVRLWNRQGQQVVEISTTQISDFSFSPDRKLLAIAINYSKQVELWNLQGQRVTAFKTDIQSRLEKIGFSPDGKLLFVAGGDRVQLWNLKGKRIAAFSTSNKLIDDIRFSPDIRYLVINSDGRRLWNFQGKSGHKFFDISFSPDGKWFATVGYDNYARLGKIQKDYKVVYSWPTKATQVKFSPDSQQLATVDNPFTGDSKVKMWNLKGQQVSEFLNYNLSNTNSLQFSDNGMLLATVQSEYRTKTGENLQKVRLWNVQRQQVTTLPSKNNYTFSPDGKLLAAVGDDKKIRVWGLQGRQVATFAISDSEYGLISFSPDSKLLYTNQLPPPYPQTNKVRLWNLQGQEVAAFSTRSDIKFSPDGKLLAAVGDDNKVWLWDRQGQQIATFPTVDVGNEDFLFSPDGKLLAIVESSGHHRKVKLWNLQGQEAIAFPINNVRDVKFSPDGKFIAIVESPENDLISTQKNLSEDLPEQLVTVKLWNLQRQQLATFPAGNFAPELYRRITNGDVKFSPDGKLIAIVDYGSDSNRARLWNLQGQQIATLPNIKDIKFSPDGKLLAAVGNDSKASLWNSRGQLLTRFPNGYIQNAWFSPDGKLLTLARGSKLELWNLQAQQVAEFATYNSAEVSFSPDSKLLATNDGDGKVSLWRVRDLDELLSEGCDYLKDYFVTHPETLKELHVCQAKLGIRTP
jgi:WD40 repeat protein